MPSGGSKSLPRGRQKLLVIATEKFDHTVSNRNKLITDKVNKIKDSNVYTFARFIRVFSVQSEGAPARRRYVRYTKMTSRAH